LEISGAVEVITRGDEEKLVRGIATRLWRSEPAQEAL